MLFGVLAFLVLTMLAIAIVARVTVLTMRRLGLEPIVVLSYFGLTDGPADELAARRAARRARSRRRLRGAAASAPAARTTFGSR